MFQTPTRCLDHGVDIVSEVQPSDFVAKASPLTDLSISVNEPVIIRLKWGQTEYHGRLISVDSYMNIQLSNTEEFIDGKSTGTLGQVLIRYVG